MATDLLAPVRLGIRITVGVLRLEARILEGFLDVLAPQREDAEEWVPADARRPVQPTPADVEPLDLEPEPLAPDVAPEPLAPEPAVALEPEAPAHIDDKPELVAEFSDPGAEEGAGAELHVEEPWQGYRSMSAADVRDRVAVAEAAELAVVQLYESTHRKRRTILDAAQRRGRELANAPAR